MSDEKLPISEAQLFALDDESRRLILDHMDFLTGKAARQMKAGGGTAKRLHFPAPKTDLEREAMRMFLREVEIASGLPRANITTGHGHA
jgi:hypothetical protein